MTRYSLIAPVPLELTNTIKNKIDSFITTHGPVGDPVGFDPHITLAYLPDGLFLSSANFRKVYSTLIVLNYPLRLKTQKPTVTSYGSLQIPLESIDVDIRQLHLKVLHNCFTKKMWKSVIDKNEEKILSTFQTSNIGHTYQPHITVFVDKNKGLKFRPFIDDIAGLTINISTFYWADSTIPPLKWIRDFRESC